MPNPFTPIAEDPFAPIPYSPMPAMPMPIPQMDVPAGFNPFVRMPMQNIVSPEVTRHPRFMSPAMGMPLGGPRNITGSPSMASPNRTMVDQKRRRPQNPVNKSTYVPPSPVVPDLGMNQIPPGLEMLNPDAGMNQVPPRFMTPGMGMPLGGGMNNPFIGRLRQFLMNRMLGMF